MEQPGGDDRRNCGEVFKVTTNRLRTVPNHKKGTDYMTIEDLISECTAYDFKLMLEEKRSKSWLKSVSAFANGQGGSLFFGMNNDGVIQGLDDMQGVTEKISSAIKERMDPMPDVEAIPHIINDIEVLELNVHPGRYTPYYYVGDGQRLAFVRMGDESVQASAEQMVSNAVAPVLYTLG